MPAVEHWKTKVSDMVDKIKGQWTNLANPLREVYKNFKNEITGVAYVDDCYIALSQMLTVLIKEPQHLFHLYPWLTLNDGLVQHLGDCFQLDMPLWRRIQAKSYRHGSAPAKAILQLDKMGFSDELSRKLLFDPEIFTRNSKLAIKLKSKMLKAIGSNTLEQLAQNDKIRATMGLPDVFRYDPMSTRPSSEETWSNASVQYRKCMDH